MPKKIRYAPVLAQAKKLTSQITTDDDAISKLALLHPDASLQVSLVSGRGRAAQLRLPKLSDIWKKAAKAFAEIKKVLEDILCTKLDYCAHEGTTQSWLKKYLPKIMDLFINGSPTGTIAKILALLGVGEASWAAIAAIVTAWLLKQSLDSLCSCPAA